MSLNLCGHKLTDIFYAYASVYDCPLKMPPALIDDKPLDEDGRSAIDIFLAVVTRNIHKSQEAKNSMLSLYKEQSPRVATLFALAWEKIPPEFLLLPQQGITNCCKIYALLCYGNENEETKEQIYRLLKKKFSKAAECMRLSQRDFSKKYFAKNESATPKEYSEWKESQQSIMAYMCLCRGDSSDFRNSSDKSAILFHFGSILMGPLLFRYFQSAMRLSPSLNAKVSCLTRKWAFGFDGAKTALANKDTGMVGEKSLFSAATAIPTSLLDNRLLCMSDIIPNSERVQTSDFLGAMKSIDNTVKQDENEETHFKIAMLALVINKYIDIIISQRRKLAQQIAETTKVGSSDTEIILSKEIEKLKDTIASLEADNKRLSAELKKDRSEENKIRKELSQWKYKESSLITENDSLIETINDLQNELDYYTQFNFDNDLNNDELDFDLENEDALQTATDTEELTRLLEGKQIVIAGGTTRWIARIKAAYPNFTFIGPRAVNEATKEYPNADLVLINNLCISHKVFNSVFDNAKKCGVTTAYLPKGQSIQNFENALVDALRALSDNKGVKLVQLQKRAGNKCPERSTSNTD